MHVWTTSVRLCVCACVCVCTSFRWRQRLVLRRLHVSYRHRRSSEVGLPRPESSGGPGQTGIMVFVPMKQPAQLSPLLSSEPSPHTQTHTHRRTHITLLPGLAVILTRLSSSRALPQTVIRRGLGRGGQGSLWACGVRVCERSGAKEKQGSYPRHADRASCMSM